MSGKCKALIILSLPLPLLRLPASALAEEDAPRFSRLVANHPRLLVAAGELAGIRENIRGDAALDEVADRVLATGNVRMSQVIATKRKEKQNRSRLYQMYWPL